MTQGTFSTAFQLHAWGYSVVPSGGGESGKQPLVDWKPYQDEQPSDEQIEDWNTTYSPAVWGIVTNSSVAVIDADTTEARDELEADLGSPHVSTPSGGAHFYINTTGNPLPTKTNILPGVDIRGEGGFVNILGDGYHILTLPHPDNLVPYERIPERILAALNGRKPPLEQGQPILEGQRNDALARMAGAMRRQGMTQEEIEAGLLVVNSRRCNPPLQDAEVRKIATSIATYPPNSGINKHTYNVRTGHTDPVAKRDKNGTDNGTTSYDSEARELSRFESLTKQIETWVKDTTGWWETQELDRELGIDNPKAKENRKKVLQRLREKGIVEKHTKINKQYRYINAKVTSLDFKTVGKAGVLPVKWPLGIENEVNLFPGNVVVVAGSPNSGKTALVLEFIYLNQHEFPIHYFCSEMGEAELQDRLSNFPDMGIQNWEFKAYEQASNFADVVVPDCINIFDFVEMTTDLWGINDHLTNIAHRLGSGLAIAVIQKKIGARNMLGRGAEFGLEKPKLYLSMDTGRCRIVKGKAWARKGCNPNGRVAYFEIVDGCVFRKTKDWHRSENG